LLAHGLVFMAVRRSRFEARQIWLLLGVLVVATLMTLAYGYWGYLVTRQRSNLGLHSVGHVNHSAIYMAIVFGLALAAASASALAGWRRTVLWGVTLLLFVSLLETVARGALIPAGIFLVLWSFHWLVHRRGVSPVKLVVAACVFVVIALIAQPEVIDKTALNIAAGQVGSYRPALARVSVLAAREYPLFGVGPSQFHKISPELVSQWQADGKAWFAPEDLYFSSHAHGLYANTLAERGLVGLAVLLTLLAAWGLALKRGVPGNDASPLAHTLWGGALSGWVLTVVGGFFNTTFHHEHAMVTALLIALWLSWRRQEPQSA
ncbi:MAG TPA: O-antigen ligase family protein, partial [Rhodocyclaceae bacterium]|nr:O-antigen ligase family protein [Rhodocyclaceae bacterium]